MRKPIAAGLELSLFAAALMAVMLVVMWIQRPSADCTLSFAVPDVLVLSRAADRERLATDLVSADRIARRYMRSGATGEDQRVRFEECKATLSRQLAMRHGLPSKTGAQ